MYPRLCFFFKKNGLFGLYCKLKNLFMYYGYVKICDLKHFPPFSMLSFHFVP